MNKQTKQKINKIRLDMGLFTKLEWISITIAITIFILVASYPYT